MTKLASVILAAGHGTRMKSSLPKVLHPVGGRPMLHHVMATAAALGAERQVVVVGANAERVSKAATAFDAEVSIAVQDPPQGTGDAVMQALPALAGFDGVVLILYADTPLITAPALERLAGAVADGAALSVLGFETDTPGAYGRLVTDAQDGLDRIVEAKDASPEELAIGFCNAGVMAVEAAALSALLPKIDNNNAKGEYYLTDLAALVRATGQRAVAVRADEAEVSGVNNQIELAAAEATFQARARAHLMTEGVTMTAPETVWLSYDTQIGRGVTLAPNVVFGPGVTVEEGAVIHAFSHIEGARIAAGAAVGPFARLRPGTDIGEGAKVGNFVETKKATLAAGAKVSHLTYLGDAEVGAEANIGAGTITCNYDGYEKFKTVIGAGAFIGSNSSLVAPVTIADGAYVGSGSVITRDVAPGSLAVARGRQVEREGWAVSFRSRKTNV